MRGHSQILKLLVRSDLLLPARSGDEKTSLRVLCECSSIMIKRHPYVSVALLKVEDVLFDRNRLPY